MSLDILWSPPYKVYEGASYQWRREWCIPNECVNGFFIFWKKHKFSMLADGFTVTKNKADNKWYLFETKDVIGQFKTLGTQSNENIYIEPHPGFVLPEYKIKNSNGLRPWQINSVEKLVSSILSWGAAIDGSDCGVGKSYSACAVARELGCNILVVCPKSVITSWHKVIINHFKMGDKLVGIINYEKLRIGRKDSDIASFVLSRQTRRESFAWKIPKKTIIIWDESQKLKNWKTQNAKTCVAAIKQGYPMLFCSATNATNPLEMRVVGLALKVYKASAKAYYDWAKVHGVYQGTWGMEFNNDPVALKRIHHVLFNQSGVRLRRDEIPNFPACEIISEVYDMDDEDAKKINSIYNEMEKELEKWEKNKKGDGESHLTIQLRARQKIELIKVPLFVEMIEEALEQRFSIAVFVNFTETIKALSDRLNTKCIFDGKTSDKIRDNNVDQFQLDNERIILVNIQSGGAGLNLHDLNGNFPRMSIISPTYSPVFMRQTLGRVWRDDAKTKAVQKIVCVAKTVEENVCRNVQQKLENMDILNDGVLTERDLEYGKTYESNDN